MTTQRGRGSARAHVLVLGVEFGLHAELNPLEVSGPGESWGCGHSVLNESGWQLARVGSLSKPAVLPPITGPEGGRAIFSFAVFG